MGSTFVFAQQAKDSTEYKKLDSLFYLHAGKYDEDAYKSHHDILKRSIKLSYLKREMEGYKSLAWYHGHGHVKERNLDSTIYYFDRYESRLMGLDTTTAAYAGLSESIVGHYMNKGSLFATQLGFIEQGLENYFEAYPYIKKDQINYFTLYDIYVSQVYMFKNQYDKAIETLEPRLKDTSSLGMTHKLYLMQNLALYYSLKETPEKSFKLNSRILEIAKEEENEYYIWWTKNEMCTDYFLFGNPQRAIDSALVVRSYYSKNINKDALFNNSQHLGEFYHAIGDVDKAIFYLKEATKFKFSTSELPDVYSKIASYYMEKKDYQSSIKFFKKKDSMIDSIRNMEKSLLVNYSDANIRLMNEKQINKDVLYQNQLLGEKNKKQRLYIVVIGIALITLLLLLVVVYLYNKNRKGKKVIGALKANEKYLLEEQIRLRDNELDASAIALAQKVEALNMIKSELDKVKDDNPKLAHVNKIVKDLIASSSDLSLVTDRIESQYPTIATELRTKHPELSETEIRYCLLTKLNLSIKETASMLNVAPNTVKVTRSRIKKKMAIPQGISFKGYLDQLYDTTSVAG